MTQTAGATNRTMFVSDDPLRLPRQDRDAEVVCLSSIPSRGSGRHRHHRAAELTSLAARANRTAQERVVRRLLGRVKRLAFMLVGNRTDGGDASQTSIMAILQFANRFSADSTLERWADQIVLKNAVRAVLEPEPHEFGWGVPALGDTSADPAVVVHEYLSRLTPNARAVLVLRELLEYSIDEIAHMTGVSRDTAQERLMRAREALHNAACRDCSHAERARPAT